MPFINKFTQVAFWLAIIAFVLAASAASAQTYPSDVGSISAGADDTEPAPRSSVEVTGTTLDSAGNPLVGVEVTFTITSNPGDASFSNGEDTIVAKTDENGIATATLNTGNEPGTIVVAVEAAGLLSQVTITTGDPQSLPSTGGAPGSDVSLDWPVLLTVAAAVFVLGTAAVGLIARRRFVNK